VAIFRMQISSVVRSTGRRATAAAAYRAGERIRDERSGDLHNFSRRRDVLHTEIFLPSQFDGVAIAWARNREKLWNTAEHAEKRHNSHIAREYQVSLPVELDAGQRLALARSFSREIAERYKVAVDLSVHEPRADGDPRNFHAHLLTTTREVTPAGLGAKTGLDMTPLERRRRELPDHRQEFVSIRERWASLTNHALQEANVAARVDHRSLAAQGIDREPLPAIPLMHLKMEQRGVPSGVAERLRSEYRARVQMREQRTARTDREPSVVQARTERAAEGSAEPVTDVEEIRRRAREAWLLLRSKEAGSASAPFLESVHDSSRATPDHDAPQSEQQPRDDFAL
jgi:ATP-dependent exoDNAse (exonuclease V) alpha subunit